MNKNIIDHFTTVIYLLVAAYSGELVASDSISYGMKSGYQFSNGSKLLFKEPGSYLLGTYIGYDFNYKWRGDFGYQNMSSVNPVDTTELDVKLFEAALKYTSPLSDELSIYSRGGVAYWMVKQHQSSDANGFSFLGEVGLNYGFSNAIQGNIGYQYIPSVGDGLYMFDSHSLVLSLSYRFGENTSALSQIKESDSRQVNVTRYDPLPFKTNVTQAIPIVTDSEHSIYFDFDKYSFNRESLINLNAILTEIQKETKIQSIIVTGHTDSLGSILHNQGLSEKRAKEVAHFIVRDHINKSKVIVIGSGELKPIADNSTIKGRKTNRRVDIIIKRSR